VLAGVVLRHRVDVIVAQSPYEGAAAVPVRWLLALTGRRVCLVVEAHGDFEQGLFLYRRSGLDPVLRRLMRAAASLSLRAADAGRAVSSAAARQLLERAPGLPVTIFPAWVDVETFDIDARPVRPSRSDLLVFAGAVVPGKGLHVLVEALDTASRGGLHARLAIAGPEANPDYLSELQASIRTRGLSGQVSFAGPLPADALSGMLGEARALVLPSFSEGTPRVVLEAMLRGTPVVASALPGVLGVIADGETGFLAPPGDAAGLAAALARVFADPELDALAARARLAARRTASTARFVEGHRRLLMGCADGPQRLG
jgi:glycosyltransferase involved in cell wall biosynthesis